MRVLVACECSGEMRRAFRALGHDAWSCDLKPAEDGDNHHIRGDAIGVLWGLPWDLVIAHPVCKYLANSGSLRLYKGGKKSGGIDTERMAKVRDGAYFFRQFFTEYSGPLCVENPIMHKWAREYVGLEDCTRQIIQPYQFGEDASKATCLWLRGLRSNQTNSGQNRLGPSEHRAADRARTYPGIAKAVAEQWSSYLIHEHPL